MGYPQPHSDKFINQFLQAKENILKRLKSEVDSERWEERVNIFLLQLLVLWILQKKKFLDDNPDYLIEKFHEIANQHTFNYINFILQLCAKLKIPETDKSYFISDIYGKIWLTGEIPIFDLNEMRELSNYISNSCFYTEGQTEQLQQDIVNNEHKITIFNVLEAHEWLPNEIHKEWLGTLYSKLLPRNTKFKYGIFYTPPEITDFISSTAISTFILQKIHELFEIAPPTFEIFLKTASRVQIIQLFTFLTHISILDPAVGTGHFLLTAGEQLLNFYLRIIQRLRELRTREMSLEFSLITNCRQKNVETQSIDILDLKPTSYLRIWLKRHLIYPQNLFGLDIDRIALKITQIRLFFDLLRDLPIISDLERLALPNLIINVKHGDCLCGFITNHNLMSQDDIIPKPISNLKTFQHLITEVVSNIPICIQNNYLNFLPSIELASFNQHILKDEVMENNDEFWKIYFKLISFIRILLKRIINTPDYLKWKSFLSRLQNFLRSGLNDAFRVWLGSNHNDISVSHQKSYPEFFHWNAEFPEIIHNHSGFSIILGNPPYGNLLSRIQRQVVKTYAGYPKEISSVFIERLLEIQNKSGVLALITSYAITFHLSLAPTRQKLHSQCDKIYLASFDRDNCRLFEEMSQSVSILFAYRSENKKRALQSVFQPFYQIKSKNHTVFYTSEMFREVPKLDKIVYAPADSLLMTQKAIKSQFDARHRLPKIGRTFKILSWLVTQPGSLKILIKDDSPCIWYRSSGNYWYNAWDRQPYESSEIKQLPILNEYHDFVILLINSQLFYLWLRIYGDGRHLNKDILKNMPIPALTQIQQHSSQLKAMRVRFMKKLFDVFDSKRNLFESSRIKRDLDQIDYLLLHVYRVPNEKFTDFFQFLCNFEISIHKGQQFHI